MAEYFPEKSNVFEFPCQIIDVVNVHPGSPLLLFLGIIPRMHVLDYTYSFCMHAQRKSFSI